MQVEVDCLFYASKDRMVEPDRGSIKPDEIHFLDCFGILRHRMHCVSDIWPDAEDGKKAQNAYSNCSKEAAALYCRLGKKSRRNKKG